VAGVWGGGGRGEKAVCGSDEDLVTMAVEAADKAIGHSGVASEDIEALYLGTASAPYIEKYVAPILAETLWLRPEATVADYCGSLNATAMALLGCLDAIRSGRVRLALVVGSENRAVAPGSEGEASFGAGAVAFVVGGGEAIAEVEDVHTFSTLLTDRWRASDQDHVSDYFDYRFAREYGYQKHVVEAVNGLLRKSGREVGDFAHVVLPQPDDRLPGLAARSLGIKREQLAGGMVFGFFGDLGSASPFIGLAAVLDRAGPGQRVLLASYGSGAAVAFSLRVTDLIEKKRARAFPLERYLKRKEYIDYTTYLKLTGNVRRAPY